MPQHIKNDLAYMPTNLVRVIRTDYRAGDLNHLDAIEQLQRLGFCALDAEAMVDGWDTTAVAE